MIEKVNGNISGAGGVPSGLEQAISECRKPLKATPLPKPKARNDHFSPIPVSDEMIQKALEKLAEVRRQAG
jgi:hypothetical protein